MSAEPTVASSDKRTMIIALVTMASLVLVGVVSGAVFSRSACDRIDPEPVAAGAAGTDLEVVLAEAFPDLDDAGRDGLRDALRSLETHLGPISGAAEVTGADGLAVSSDGVAATGPVTTLLAADGAEVLARADLGDGRPVGDGGTIYALAVTNELTGQIDALRMLDDRLGALTCVDTALVGSPLAFHLDAGDGQLLLLRIDEDGDDPVLELRDAVDGRIWAAPLELGIAPAGLQGQRLSARLGTELVVAGRRSAPGDEQPVLTAVARADGEPVWTIDRQDLADSLGDSLGDSLATDLAQWVEVLAVADGRVAVRLEPDPDEEAEEQARAADATGPRLLVLDAIDGTPLWDVAYAPTDRIRDVVLRDDRLWAAVAGADGTLRLEERDGGGELETTLAASGSDGGSTATRTASGSDSGSTATRTVSGSDGESTATRTASGRAGRIVVLDEGRVVLVGGGAIAISGEPVAAESVGDEEVVQFGPRSVGRAVVAHSGGVTVLLHVPSDGDDPTGGGDGAASGPAVAVTFTG